MIASYVCIKAIFVLFLRIPISTGHDDTCPPGEQPVDCIENTECTEQSCSQRGRVMPCPDVKSGSCTAGCICSDGYLRNDNGECVPESTCPEQTCPPNEELSSCQQAVCRPVNCSQRNQPIACPRIAEGFCESGCVCEEGFLRTDDGVCVSEESCPDDLDCGENEEVDTCPGSCSDFCPTSEDDNECSTTDQNSNSCGPPECRCGFNYKRDNGNGACIPTRDCPPFDCSARPNEEYNSCPPLCSDDCSHATASGDCHFVGRIGIVLECQPTCRCIEGYWRSNGICVPYADCRRCNGPHEFYSCGGACDNVCATLDEQSQNNCPIVNVKCNDMCYCEEGYARAENNTCIPISDCDDDLEISCGGDSNAVPGCGVNCGRHCSDLDNTESVACPDICQLDGCDCKKGYYYNDHTQRCVKPEDCVSCGGDTNAVPGCGVNCGRHCSDLDNTEPVACRAICQLDGCDCKQGYYYNDDTQRCVKPEDCANAISACGENEVLNQCPSSCNTDACPTSLDDDDDDEFCATVCGSPRCECKENYKRDKNGNCIPIQDCPNAISACGENEVLNQCPSVCDTDACPTSLDDKYDEPCIDVCGSPRCECKENYNRDSYGNCIPRQSCPGICPDNEEYSSCMQDVCRAQDCTQIGQPIECIGIIEDACQEGCVCVPGTLRDENGKCVPQDQCPNLCPVNEQFYSCAQNLCRLQDCSQLGQQITCVAIEDDFCQGGCVCVPGTLRDDNGNCVPENECPTQICPFYEEFYSCTQNLCRPQYCSQSGQETSCVAIEDEFCQGGCVCVPGTLRDDNGNCVPENECPIEQQCFGQNEELSCEPTCPPERTCRNRDIKFNCLASDEPCKEKCVCKPGFFRNAIGDCISGDECDQCPGANEFFSCGTACDNNCFELATQNRTNCPIVNIVCNRKCYCEDGYARNDEDNCVPVAECPKETKCADPNEEFRACKQTCPPDSCFSLVARFKCVSDPPCEPGCNCKPGYLRVNATSPCVKICSCPEMTNSPDCY